MSLAARIDRARAAQVALREGRRAAFRSPPVPFVPEPLPARGWRDLEEDIAAEFAEHTSRTHAVEDAHERLRSRRMEAERETRRFAPWRLSTAANKALRARRRAAGLCIFCPTPLANQWHCAAHAESERRRQAVFRDRATAAGRCANCSRPAEPGRSRCRAHLDKGAAYQASRFPPLPRPTLPEGRRCKNCAQTALMGKTCCADCAEKARGRARNARDGAIAMGRCLNCNHPPMPGRRRCRQHLERETVRRARRLEARTS